MAAPNLGAAARHPKGPGNGRHRQTLCRFCSSLGRGYAFTSLVEATILLAAARTNPAVVLREAASTYKVDTDAIALKVKQEFAAKAKAKKEAKPVPKAKKAA